MPLRSSRAFPHLPSAAAGCRSVPGLPATAMAVVTGSKRRRLEEEEEERLEDRISLLPDDILGDIVYLLPPKDGARTQVLSSRWRPLWRSAPVNFDFYDNPVSDINSILSSHPGPVRRFAINMVFVHRQVATAALDATAATLDAATVAAAALDAWLRCPALNSLQELKFYIGSSLENPNPLLPVSVRRFSCTLRVASFRTCRFPDGNVSALHLPLLNQLSLVSVMISETSLHALLAGCSVLESLLLQDTKGVPRVQIMSTSLRSIGVRSHFRDDRLRQLIIKDAPSLERLLIFNGTDMDVSVISVPKLKILKRPTMFSRLQFGATTFQGSSLTTVVCSVKDLALTDANLSLDEVINLLKCFPCLEKLYIQTADVGEKNTWHRKYRNLLGTLDIRLKQIVLSHYRGNKSHVNFASFFVSNAAVLESMRFELEDRNVRSAWIERQHRLLQIEKKASRVAQFYFVSRHKSIGSLWLLDAEEEQVHDLSTADPFERFHHN